MPKGHAQPTRDEIEKLRGCAAPIVWGDGKGRYSNGTISFFGLFGKDPIAITNWHVFDEFSKKLEESGGAIGVLNLPFDFSKRHIDSDKTLDLATFRITNSELLQLKKLPAFQTDGYQSAEAGMGVCLVGYPGQLRINAPFSVGCRSITLSGFKIDEVGDTYIRVSREIDRDAIIEEVTAQLGETDFTKLGGISGCPIMGICNHPSGVVPILLGVLSMESDLLDSWLVKPIRCINPDGTLNR